MIDLKKPNRGFWAIALAVAVLAGFLPLLYPALPAGHDILFHLARIQALTDGIKDGVFPVYVNFRALDGFGYGTGLFYSDFFLCIPTLFSVCGLGVAGAYKLFLVLWGLASAFSMRYCLRNLNASDFGAFAGSLLYVWSSYFSIDIFTRAALGEVTAFPFLPLIIVGVYRLIYDRPGRIFPLTFGFAGLLLAHQITFVLMGLFAGLFCGLCLPRFLAEPRRILCGALAAVLAVGLAAFFLFPMMEQLMFMKLNLMETTLESPIAGRTVSFVRLFLELPYTKLEFWTPPGIGIIFLVAAFQRFRLKSGWSNEERFRDCLLIAGFAALLFATDLMPWQGKIMKPLAAMQFPWRSYLPATAFLAAAGGLLISNVVGSRSDSMKRWLWILLVGCGFAWFFNTAYAYAAKISEKNLIRQFTPKMAARNVASGLHYLPAGMRLDDIQAFGTKPKCVPETVQCELSRSSDFRKMNVKFTGNTSEDSLRVTLPLIPYAGYEAVLENGSKAPAKLQTGHNRFFSFVVPAGHREGAVTVAYRGTVIQKASALLSLALLLGLGSIEAVLLFRGRGTAGREKKKEKKKKKGN